MANVSVIVPVYNVEKKIVRCIESIRNQLYKEWELILIDDGSKDNSGKICDYYREKDERIIVIHKKNEGVSIARNVGIEKSNAQWLCFVDSDDWVDEYYLSSFMNAIDDTTEFVSQGIIRENSTTNSKISLFQYDDVDFSLGDDRLALYKVLHNGVPYAKLYKKEILQKNSIFFDKRISFHEDHIFVINYLYNVKKLQLLANSSYHYIYWGAGSLSSRFNKSEELIITSDELITVIERIRPKLSPRIDEYIRSLINSYGIYQLICACKNVTSSNYYKIFSECNTRFQNKTDYLLKHSLIYNYIIKCVRYHFLYSLLYSQMLMFRLLKIHRFSVK